MEGMNTNIMDINRILDEARNLGCSDLHFTAGLPPVVRLHGSIRKLSGYPDCTEPIIVNIINQITSIKHKSQISKGLDTDFSYVSTAGFRHRVNVYRQRGYHAVAIRLLRNDIPTLADLSLPATLGEFAMAPRGLVLVTGPTGSGKSTTLYATLGELSKPNVNIVTVEDPVEKKIDGVNQCQINAKAGMTFAAALRSILRQDPDIIMVGEIRDGETADIAIRAAITGHFVLSTLHTNDAASTIVRLVDMGVAPYMVASSLVGIIAQRLVKLLCNECKETITLSDPADLRLVSRDKPVQICQAHKGGCKKCRGTGYSGRTAIHEIIVTSNDIKELISKGATAEEIGAKATENGTLLLRDNVTQMVLAGRTTMDELVKATYTV